MVYGTAIRLPRRPAPVWAPEPTVPQPGPIIRWAFYLFVFSIPFEMPQRTIPIEIPTLTGAFFLLTTLLDVRACYARIPRALLGFGGWLLALFIGALVNPHDDKMLLAESLLRLVQLVLVLWAGVNVMRAPGALRATLLVLVAACALRAGMQIGGIGVTAKEVWTGGQRESILGQNKNLSALILSAGLLATLGLRYARGGSGLRPRFVIWPLLLLLGTAVVQTGSRGGLVALAAGLLVFLFRGRTFWERLRGSFAVLVGMGFLVWASFTSEMMRARFEDVAEGGRLADRELIYPALLGMIAERPLLGWGQLNNQFEVARRIGDRQHERRDAHNLLLEVLSTTGVLGTIPFLTGLLLCAGAAWRARRGPYGVLACAMLASILVGTMSGTWIASKILWLTLAISLATETVRSEG